MRSVWNGSFFSFLAFQFSIWTVSLLSFFQIYLDPCLSWSTGWAVVWRIWRQNPRLADRTAHLCQPSWKHSRSVHDQLSQPSSQRKLQRCDCQCCSSNALSFCYRLPNRLQRSCKWYSMVDSCADATTRPAIFSHIRGQIPPAIYPVVWGKKGSATTKETWKSRNLLFVDILKFLSWRTKKRNFWNLLKHLC